MDPERAARFPFVPGDTPLVIERTEGVWLVTDSGQRILDAGGGAIVTNIGHGRPEIARVAADALGRIDYLVPLWATEARVSLVEELVDHWLPDGFTRCAFVSGGSESVDLAVRIARTHHLAAGRGSRWKTIGRDVAYHGSTLSGLSVGAHDRRRTGLEPMLTELPKSPWLDPDALAKVIEYEDPDTISAFIGEPITGAAGGAMVPPEGYWPAVEEVCRRHGILLIVDEVMTGLGRTGLNWGHQHFGFTPDLIVAGKGLSGGYAPMGGVYGTDEVVKPIAEAGKGMMYYTFAGQDLGCAISVEVLRIMRAEGLVARAATMGNLLRRRLDEELGDHPHVADIRGRGLMLGVELVADRNSGRPFPRSEEMASQVVAAAIERDLWVYPAGSGPIDDAILIGPPFTITEEHVELIVTGLRAAIDAAVARSPAT
ncbi:MAG: aspartate aminotransferase family protein [Actinomycetia bacterium]|nr:aspartate aminotransferase family protein [Actinomycetes bacterium]